MLAPVIRIALRYGAGFLVANGLLDPESGLALGTDPDVIALLELGVGAVIAAATEAYYYVARKMGWAT